MRSEGLAGASTEPELKGNPPRGDGAATLSFRPGLAGPGWAGIDGGDPKRSLVHDGRNKSIREERREFSLVAIGEKSQCAKNCVHL